LCACGALAAQGATRSTRTLGIFMKTWTLLALSAIGMAPSEMTDIQSFASLAEWEAAPAYFVDAPRASRAEMRNAVASLVMMVVCPNWTRADWICTKQGWRYFQAVSGRGTAMKHGYACTSAEIPYQNYYSERMLRRSRCVSLVWHESTRKFAVKLIEEDA
jgi:hypothetical protein